MKTGHLIHTKTWVGLATSKCQVLGERQCFFHGYHHWEDGQALVEDHISKDIWTTQNLPSLVERKTIAKYTNLHGYEEWFAERSWRSGFNVIKNVTQSLKMLMKEKIKRNKADKEPANLLVVLRTENQEEFFIPDSP